jgi:hypothetical protein
MHGACDALGVVHRLQQLGTVAEPVAGMVEQRRFDRGRQHRGDTDASGAQLGRSDPVQPSIANLEAI